MRIDFFEEFPTSENLEKAALLPFPSTIYVAAKSLDEFFVYKTQLTTINPAITVGYWPVMARSYWISPFSYPQELDQLYVELENYHGEETLKVMVDLELPLLQKKLLLKNSIFFFKNKRTIKKILLLQRTKSLTFLTAEYPPVGKISHWLSRKLGISYHPRRYNHTPIFMFYTSMIEHYGNNLHLHLHQNISEYIKKEASTIQHIQLGLGTIAQGILGTEPVLSPAKLKDDLIFLKEIGVTTAVIFRLGGLTKEYLDVILENI
jgi:hypothetical protein